MRMKKSQWKEVIDLNLTGVYLCTQACIFISYYLAIFYDEYLFHHDDISPAGSSKNYDEEEKGILFIYIFLAVGYQLAKSFNIVFNLKDLYLYEQLAW